MLQPKPQYFPTAEANFERCMVTLEIIQNERLIELKGQKGAFFLMHYLNFWVIHYNVFLYNQTAGFFDNQYLWNTAINILDFLCRDSNYRKVASESTTIDNVWSGMPSHVQTQTCLNLSVSDLFVCVSYGHNKF